MKMETDILSDEKWKPIPGFEEKYEISNKGRIRSIDRSVLLKKGILQFRKGKIIKLNSNTKGYLFSNLYCKGKHKPAYPHRLVAESFINNPNRLPEVNHIDGNKQNNTVNNLEWVTREENIHHFIKLGLRKDKLTMQQANEIKAKYSSKLYSQNELAKEYGVSQSHISSIVTGRRWGWHNE